MPVESVRLPPPDDLPDPNAELQRVFDSQRRAFAANPMPVAGQRLQWLDSLRQLLSHERQALIDAISTDFSHRSADETLLAELMPSLHNIHYARRHLKKWMRASRRHVGMAFQPASAKVIYQPLGVIGVIVPWNYPLYLAIGPLVGALAAGNRVMLKLSESTPATGELLKKLFAQVFPEDLVSVVLGEADVGVAFSRLRSSPMTCR
jgi:coniferyl-aldehyde dehydrogenase